MHYSIAKTTYIFPQTEVIFNSHYYRDTCEELESIIVDFINTLEVQRRIPIYYKKSRSGRYGSVPLGYFIVKSASFHKLTILHKYQFTGYLYNTTKIDKIASFRITKNMNIERQEPLIAKEKLFMIAAMCIITKKEGDGWKQIHKAIIEKGKPKEILVV
jgi:hypothetical protein